jgi:excisionase family DNA binding protein
MERKKIGYRPLEVAKALGIGETLARELIRKGEIKSVKIGRVVIVPHAEIDAYLQRLLAAAVNAVAER